MIDLLCNSDFWVGLYFIVGWVQVGRILCLARVHKIGADHPVLLRILCVMFGLLWPITRGIHWVRNLRAAAEK